MPRLEELYWDGNNFTGPIPPSVSSLKLLTKISFNLNSMSGPIPPGLGKLPLTDCRIGSDTDFKPCLLRTMHLQHICTSAYRSYIQLLQPYSFYMQSFAYAFYGGRYDTSAGSPERAWLLKWLGNTFDCPVPPAILKSVCNAQEKGCRLRIVYTALCNNHIVDIAYRFHVQILHIHYFMMRSSYTPSPLNCSV